MNNSRETPRRAVRIPDQLWQDAMRIAQYRGESVSDILRRALVSYVRRHRNELGD